MRSLLARLYIVNHFRLCLRVAFHISVGRSVSFEMEVKLKGDSTPHYARSQK